ncbi:fructose-1-phosphate kinase [Marininema mesophilum]|uniref:Tagatose-6-phosphate kinase n=1 Tax=Marininema mesophilum TaxID=1048340 RepID=A0A1H2Z2Q3_9BACL|nr:1-phosphofructokinase [Marininema mesophilum]SDX11605.1 fructose-1-phosphate kinase [Marininema mesophilum]
MSKVLTVTLNPAMDKTLMLSSFHPGGVNRVQEVMMTAAGKGINVARALTKWRERDFVRAFGWIGGGWQGEALLAQLDEWGISQEFIKVPGEVRTNTKLVDQNSGEVTDINEPGFTVETKDVDRLLAEFDHCLIGSELVVLSGSLPQGAPSDLYRTMIKQAKKREVTVILDADGEAFREGIQAVPHVVKPNREELQGLLQRELITDSDYLLAGQEILRFGVTCAVISMGAAGAWFFKDQQQFHVQPPIFQAINPVGAGDGMVAGIIMGMAYHWPLEQTARFATAAGAKASTIPGTGYGKRDEVHRLMKGVVIRNH